MSLPDFEAVRAAARRIGPHVHRTPIARSATLDRELGAHVVFKCENLQKVGAFKARGAVNAVLALEQAIADRGVITHSSGNHAAALAYAASLRNIRCTVVMPRSAPSIKVDAVRGYGAEIVPCERGERQSVCDRVIEREGGTFIHPYENPDVIAGQGTAALELLEEEPDLDAVYAPVGGGGLLAGTTLAVRGLRPEATVWGAEPEAADDAYRSLESGSLQPAVEDPRTLADGLLTGLGGPNFAILRQHAVRVVTVTEPALVEAARFILFRMKLVVEPSSASVLAAIRRHAARVCGLKIGAILSGGNTDLSWL